MKRLPPTVERIIIGATLVVLFLVMASVFAPDLTHAETEPGPAAPETPAARGPSTDPHAGLASLGTILDDRYRVEIYGGAGGPRYSVYDASDGRELGVLLTAEQVAEWFPDLPVPSMDFGDGAMLMLADPDDSAWPGR